MDRRKFIITTAGIAGGIGVYTYSTTPRLSVASANSVETPKIPQPLDTNQYFDIPINPFEIQCENLSTSSDITINYEIRRVSDDSSVSTATESVNVPTSGSFTVNTKGRKLRLRNSDISGGSEDFYIHITISHPDTGTLDSQSAGFTIKESGAYFNVSITGSSSPVDEGNTLTVDYEVENTGTKSDTQSIRLDVAGSQRDSNSETVASGDTVNGSLSWNSSSGDAGDYTATVSSSETSDSVNISVESVIPSRSDAVAASDAWYIPKSGGEFEQIASGASSNYPDTISINGGSYSSDYFGNGLDSVIVESEGTGTSTSRTEIYGSGSGPSDTSIAQYTEFIDGNSGTGIPRTQFEVGLTTLDDVYSVGAFVDGVDGLDPDEIFLLGSAYGQEKSVGGQLSEGAIQYVNLKRFPAPTSWTLSGPNIGSAQFSLSGIEESPVDYLIKVYDTKGAVAEFSITEDDAVPSTVKSYFEGNY